MNVSELIKVLNDIEDKTLPVRVLEDNPNNSDYNLENYWLEILKNYLMKKIKNLIIL